MKCAHCKANLEATRIGTLHCSIGVRAYILSKSNELGCAYNAKTIEKRMKEEPHEKQQ